MLDLHIVTPCIRVGNLAAIGESIRAARVPVGVTLHWLVVLDNRFGLDVEKARQATAGVPGTTVELARSEGPGEYAQCDRALELISDGWIVFLDDDNLLHPELPARLAATIGEHPQAGAIVYDQKDVRRASPRNVRVSRIDSGQFALARAFVGDDRFSVYAPAADGAFIETLYKRSPEKFVFLSETLAFYNALTPGRFGEGSLERLTPGPQPSIQTAGSLYFHRTFVSDGAAVKISSRGDRLYIKGAGSLRSPLPAGQLRMTGRARLEVRSWRGGRLTIRTGGELLVDVALSLFRRKIGFDRDFVADGEIEITFEGNGAGLVLDSLLIVPLAQNE